MLFRALLQNYNAKLSDFGLAKNGPTGGDSHVTTRVMGTYGYAAPEYVATGTPYTVRPSVFHICISSFPPNLYVHACVRLQGTCT